MANRNSGGTMGIAVVAVLVVLGAAGAFVYKTVFLDSRVPAGASAAPVAAPAPSPSASASESKAPDAPAIAAPSAGGAASGVGRAVSGVAKVVAGEPRQSQDEAERLSALQTTVQLLRSTLDLYKLEHGDNWPDFRTYPRSEQLVQYTAEDGRLYDASGKPPSGSIGGRHGPYLRSVPANPLNGAAEIVTVDGDVNEGDTVTPPPGFKKAGYVFSTSSGVVWATDATGRRVADVEAMVARQKASTPAGKQELFESAVQTVASQIQLYRLQHQDRVPDFARYPQWEQLLKKTDDSGTISPRGRFGPYLQKLPVNPYNGFSAAETVDQDPPAGFKPRGGSVGWVVSSENGRIWGTDAKGVVIPR
jgi:type II secretory pathway pseudopilin PulG